MQGVHYWAEAFYQRLIAKTVLSLLKYPKHGIRRIQGFEVHGRGMVSKIDSGLLSIVVQRFCDYLEVRGGCQCISNGRHDVNVSYVRQEEKGYENEKRRFKKFGVSASRGTCGWHSRTTYLIRSMDCPFQSATWRSEGGKYVGCFIEGTLSLVRG